MRLSNATEDDSGKSIYIVRDDHRPGTGTFTIVSSDRFTDFGGIVAYYADLTGNQWNVVIGSHGGGSITITHSSSDRVRGSFDFHASGSRAVNGEIVDSSATFTGEFDARKG